MICMTETTRMNRITGMTKVSGQCLIQDFQLKGHCIPAKNFKRNISFFFLGGGGWRVGVTIIIFYNYIYSNVLGVGGSNFSYFYFST